MSRHTPTGYRLLKSRNGLKQLHCRKYPAERYVFRYTHELHSNSAAGARDAVWLARVQSSNRERNLHGNSVTRQLLSNTFMIFYKTMWYVHLPKLVMRIIYKFAAVNKKKRWGLPASFCQNNTDRDSACNAYKTERLRIYVDVFGSWFVDYWSSICYWPISFLKFKISVVDWCYCYCQHLERV